MRKPILLLFVLLLPLSLCERISGQTPLAKDQQQTKLKDPENPPGSAPLVLANSVEPKADAKRLYEEGMKLTDEGQYPQAVETLQQAIKLDTTFADAYAALGRTYFKMRQWQLAIDNLRRASELNAKQREAQDALHKKLILQKQENASKPATDIAASSSLTSHPSAVPNEAPKNLRPQPETPRQPELTRNADSTVKNPLVTANKKPDTNASTVVTKPPAPPSNTTTAPPLKIDSKVQQAVSVPPANLSHTQVSVARAPQAFPTAMLLALNGPAFSPAEQRILEPHFPSPAEQFVELSISVPPVPTLLKSKSAPRISITPSVDQVSLTKVYRVGPGDVLDVRLNDSSSSASTLFTVTPSGLLEHPSLDAPLAVTGLTVDEVGTKIEDDLKRRALVENPKVLVGVRDYASHTILVSGLVKDPGTKFLRREAIPLYVVVADAQPLPEAAKVTVVRNELNQMFEIDLTQASDMNLLVRPGDVITLHPNVTQFFYIGGEVKIPGEKTFRRGITLTQAILTAGGATAKGKVAEIARDDGRGFLAGERFGLKEIGSGKTSDPVLKPGDRITIFAEAGLRT
jgi:protein involved in polysaccharide export with SLBB domain